MSAWARIVAKATPEELAELNEALREVQEETRRKAAEEIRRHDWEEPCAQGCCPGGTPDGAADLIDPDKEGS